MVEAKIVSARITPISRDRFGPLPEVFATFDDGREVRLFDYYPDELSFSEREFVGLTEAEGRRLKVTKDAAYLRS
ncbi:MULTISPECIES: hypothetical protein [Microvirga]|uniref:hypothetical protein n=1 Tax=Microvirga TaxID=186650 RepID=UPI000E0DEADA|nr:MULTISPECIES: hypothetical protein [Microvirga]MDG2570794.1 hypothetical protein [Vibrio parahaemolyticus]